MNFAPIAASPRSARRTRRDGFSWTSLSGALVAATVVPLMAWYAIPQDSFSAEDDGPLAEQVRRGTFVHELIERGEVESSSTVDIRCEVQSRAGSGGGVAILEIVPEGTKVKKGDILGRLDSSVLENELNLQQNICSTSAAGLIQFRTAYETAVIAKQEYLQGTYKQEEQLIESEIFVAEETLRRAQEYANYSAKLAARNFVTAVTLEADRFAVEKARKDLDTAKTKLRVLQEYMKVKMVMTLDAAIKTAEAQLKAQENIYQTDLDKLELIKAQVEKCTLVAPQDGEVTYPVGDYRDSQEVVIQEGTIVRERQTIIRLPDPERMQINAKVNESKIRLIEIGMPATISIESLADTELTGTVTKVFAYANRSRWSASSVREFSVIVEIHDPPPGLRTGSTAEVRIRVHNSPDELMVPVQAVLEHNGQHFCVWKDKKGGFVAKPVKLGPTNDSMVVIEGGLGESDKVVMNPRTYLDELNLPELPAKSIEAREMIAGRAELPTVASRDATPAASTSDKPLPSAAADESGNRGGGMLQSFDKNGDGRLAKDELPAQMGARFSGGDANGDGFLDADEISAMPRGRRSEPGALGEASGQPTGIGGGAGQ